MIRYSSDVSSLTTDQLYGFFEGWITTPLTSDQHLRVLRASHAVVALDPETDRVVGFVTALSDGVQAAFISLLEVLPEYRGRGIGTELMRRILEDLATLPAVDLTCKPDLQPFYARLGMAPSQGMVIRRYLS